MNHDWLPPDSTESPLVRSSEFENINVRRDCVTEVNLDFAFMKCLCFPLPLSFTVSVNHFYACLLKDRDTTIDRGVTRLLTSKPFRRRSSN